MSEDEVKFMCPQCQGLQQVVQPVVVVDPDTGDVSTREEAGPCPRCAGQGWI